MKLRAKSIVLACSLVLAAQAVQAAQITFYEGEGFRGRAFTTGRAVDNFNSFGYNDRASSAVVDSGSWEVCDDARFSGHCVMLRPGSYDSLRRMGLNDRISSVRVANSRRGDYVVAPTPTESEDYAWRRRPNERVAEARVTSVHAVMGPPDRHCWVDRQEVRDRGGPNVGGAVLGAVIGGVLGHQIGDGRGRDAATVGGAVVGGAIGANQNRGQSTTYDRDVRRCETTSDSTPDYWDVTYDYRGVVHHVQMSSPPGNTIWVNRNGEPRQ
jgi:uncharacterized protein YcfJ